MHLRFSFQSDLSHQLDDKLGEVEKLPSMKVFDPSEENELDTYMTREVQSLTQEELDQSQVDHC